MSHVYILVHCVWATKFRYPYMATGKRELLWEHIRENAVSKKIRLDCINGHDDHVHCLLLLGAGQSIAYVAQLLKGEAAWWANHVGLFEKRLLWASGYYAASIDESTLPIVRRYIQNQEKRHQKLPFVEEYLRQIQKDR